MAENQPIQGGSIRVGATPASNAPKSASETNGAAFQALIEKLEAQARDIQAESATVSGPNELAQAVDHAHASLQDALSLSERLLEAYRASMHAPDAPKESA
jgi:hypothetical protein